MTESKTAAPAQPRPLAMIPVDATAPVCEGDVCMIPGAAEPDRG